jgi:hypothetical protein
LLKALHLIASTPSSHILIVSIVQIFAWYFKDEPKEEFRNFILGNKIQDLLKHEGEDPKVNTRRVFT